jgi:hypothetical protein
MAYSNDDGFLNWMIGVGAVVLLGPGLLAKFMPSAQAFLLEHGILASTNVLIPIGENVGLDFARVLVALGVVALLVFLTVVSLRRRARRSEEQGRRV